MSEQTLTGWFDNRATQCRELWCSGTLRCSWPMDVVQNNKDYAPWQFYPDVPQPARRRWGLEGLEASSA